MGRITSLQNQIGALQEVLARRNETIAEQNRRASQAAATIADLREKLEKAAAAEAA